MASVESSSTLGGAEDDRGGIHELGLENGEAERKLDARTKVA